MRMPYAERQEWIAARIGEYLDGITTVTMLRASLFGKGLLRGQELDLTVKSAERERYERTKAKALRRSQYIPNDVAR